MNLYILDINYRDLLKKPPEIRDVFDIITDMSSEWYELGGYLGISMNDRDSLQGSGRIKLERILNMWKQKQTKDVTWGVILEVLEKLQRRDLMREVIIFLETPENYKKYISKRDFFVCSYK